MGGAVDTHRAVPRCLLRLHDAAREPGLDGRHIQAWLDFEHEAMRCGLPVEIDRAGLEALVETSEGESQGEPDAARRTP
ncbi:hypothetical protein BH20ACT10_BH20ACT10_10910 [soil metagenome]|jgi:hypothetical protein